RRRGQFWHGAGAQTGAICGGHLDGPNVPEPAAARQNPGGVTERPVQLELGAGGVLGGEEIVVVGPAQLPPGPRRSVPRLVWPCLVAAQRDAAGMAANREPSPSAIVGCARMASRRTVYGSPPRMAVCTAAMTSPASGPSIVKPRTRSPAASTSTF